MNHAQSRALERYDLKLSFKDLHQMAKDIVLGRGVLLGRSPHGAERWLVKVRDRAVKLIYCPETCKVITILPARTKRPRHFYSRKAVKARRRKERRS